MLLKKNFVKTLCALLIISASAAAQAYWLSDIEDTEKRELVPGLSAENTPNVKNSGSAVAAALNLENEQFSVGRITVELENNSTIISWAGVQQEGVEYEVFRALKPIENAKILNTAAKKLTNIGYGASVAVDENLSPGEYYYAVVPVYKGRRYVSLRPELSYTTIPAVIGKRKDGYYVKDIKAVYEEDSDKIILNWKPVENVLGEYKIYRSDSPITDFSLTKSDKAIAEIESYQSIYSDNKGLRAGQRCFYAVVFSNYRGELNRTLKAGENITTEAVTFGKEEPGASTVKEDSDSNETNERPARDTNKEESPKAEGDNDGTGSELEPDNTKDMDEPKEDDGTTEQPDGKDESGKEELPHGEDKNDIRDKGLEIYIVSNLQAKALPGNIGLQLSWDAPSDIEGRFTFIIYKSKHMPIMSPYILAGKKYKSFAANGGITSEGRYTFFDMNAKPGETNYYAVVIDNSTKLKEHPFIPEVNFNYRPFILPVEKGEKAGSEDDNNEGKVEYIPPRQTRPVPYIPPEEYDNTNITVSPKVRPEEKPKRKPEGSGLSSEEFRAHSDEINKKLLDLEDELLFISKQKGESETKRLSPYNEYVEKRLRSSIAENFHKGDYKIVISEIEKLLLEDSKELSGKTYARARIFLGRSYYAIGDYGKAYKVFSSVADYPEAQGVSFWIDRTIQALSEFGAKEK